MKSILVAIAVSLSVVLLGTPIAIRAFSYWGWGQRIREDGPHTHLEKMGTPTMGGIVILIGFVLGYLASWVTSQRFTATGFSLVLVTIGFGIVGFLDDYAKVKRRRSLGLTKLQKFVGTAIVSLVFAGLVMHYGASAGISHPRLVRAAHRDRARRSLRRLGLLRPHRILQRRQPHRRARRVGGRLVDPGGRRVHLHQLLAVPPHLRPAERRGGLLHASVAPICRMRRSWRPR